MKQIAVIAFGHIHFKAACAAVGVEHTAARHITNMSVFRSLCATETRLVVHVTGTDHRLRDLVVEAKRLGFKTTAEAKRDLALYCGALRGSVSTKDEIERKYNCLGCLPCDVKEEIALFL